MGSPEEANLLDIFDETLVSHCHSHSSQGKFADCIWLGPPHRKFYAPRDLELIIHVMYRILTVTKLGYCMYTFKLYLLGSNIVGNSFEMAHSIPYINDCAGKTLGYQVAYTTI